MAETRESNRYPLVDLLIIIVVVLAARIVIERVMPMFYESFGLYFGDFLFQTLSNVPVTAGAVIGDIFLVRFLSRIFPYGGSRVIVRSSVELGMIFLMAMAASVLVRLGQYMAVDGARVFFNKLFLFTYVSNVVFNAVVILSADLVFYYRWSNRRAVAVEAEKRAKANYQYQLLKSETNPHFLFNCLNVLQYLIHEDVDRASDYAAKLAGVYRYFLKLEKHDLVMLEEELEFVEKYNDLIRERFGGSFRATVEIPSEYWETRIIPCTLQMMVENAVKHNIVNSENMLGIDIRVEGKYITVTNNLNPKPDSGKDKNGMGLENISHQYEILFSKRIVVENTGREFIVRIPLVD